MKFSTRATYGLKAMLHLAERYGEGAVSIAQIAGDEKISAAYLEQILARIKREGWIKSVRGPRGGYVLTAKPSEVRVGALLKALGEETLVRVDHGRPEASGRTARSAGRSVRPAASAPSAAADRFWVRLSQEFEAALDRVSLESILESGRAAGAAAGAAGAPIHFNI